MKSNAIFIFVALLTVFFSLFFYFAPTIDLVFAQHFYQNGLFNWAHSSWAWNARYFLYGLVWTTVTITLILLIIKLATRTNHLPRAKHLAYILTVFILVPLLLINVVFKDQFGRPRPQEITEFGGALHFQKAWVVSNQCPENCSFVCGDAAVAFTFWLFLPFFRKPRWRYAYGLFVFLSGTFYGLIRMGQGGHFFSDVVLSCFLTYLGVWLVHYFFYRKEIMY